MSLFKKVVYGLYFFSSTHRLKQTNIKLKFSRKKKYLHRTGLDSNFFTKGLSRHTLEYIKFKNLSEIQKKKSFSLIKIFHEILKLNFDKNLLIYISELCYKEAEDGHKEANMLYLTSAYYSYSYLFDEDLSTLNVFSPNFILARNLYNYSLAKLAKTASLNKIDTKMPIELPIFDGKVIITSIINEFKWNIDNFVQVYAAYEFNVKGFLAENKEYGIGAPLVAIRRITHIKKSSIPKSELFLPPGEQPYATTGIIRFNKPFNSKTKSNHTTEASIEFYNPDKTTHVQIRNSQIPLNLDITAKFAYILKGKPHSRDMRRLLEPAADFSSLHNGINMLLPFDPNKIPVIFVHGLLSTSRTWEQAVNFLSKNPLLRQKYQPWFFSYPTGNPILYSARYLRHRLTKIWEHYDPEHKNPNLNNTVIIGHSMGGLLAKLLLVSSDGDLFEPFSDVPLKNLNLHKRVYHYIKDMTTFHSFPRIKRCIFISTPHKGSKNAINPFSRFSSSIIELSKVHRKNFEKVESGILKENNKNKLADNVFLRTGIGSLDPSNPTLEILEALPKSANVKYHSVFGNVKKADTPGGSDSQVTYKSSHIDYAISEKIVKCNHAAHKHPETILEIERILLEHLEEFEEKKDSDN